MIYSSQQVELEKNKSLAMALELTNSDPRFVFYFSAVSHIYLWRLALRDFDFFAWNFKTSHFRG